MHRPSDVLELLLAGILQRNVELTPRILLHAGGHTDTSWLGKPLQARSHVDPIAEDVTLLDDDVSLVNTDPELYALVLGHPGISLSHAPLDLNSTAEGFN